MSKGGARRPVCANWQYHARQPDFKFPSSCQDRTRYLENAGHWSADWCTYDSPCDSDKGEDPDARLSPIGRTGQLVYSISSQPLRGIHDQKDNTDVKYGVITSDASIIETDETHRFLSLAVNDWVVNCSYDHFKPLCEAFNHFKQLLDQPPIKGCVDRRNEFVMDDRRLKGTYFADNAGAYIVQLISLEAD